ncbi:hypothetical protein N7499_010922 [Penicillium canescens]|uniref:Uncharacterized protein n=1 Tax=Penicillium canescens TaxID=5083 RepID=A0AAD6IJ99_PENCN|nr:uncharacterized protein N7446_006211 [Penicillium canescens]KAJ5990407.1 hypothetical protein N7522_010614 [Penicillium canescens]KAJ6051579.1 hypothetical protein N7460_002113 [Penicillium canescens]KAJ6062091.1 hypothetical protein N7446_006211 [Penicillium canescens]KAJ6065341.1 hypothetical protein N7444_000994 [Penicillium canescens]KAJ6069035.1 hypothetical protein N7499_010922 [Penicillium canescens]
MTIKKTGDAKVQSRDFKAVEEERSKEQELIVVSIVLIRVLIMTISSLKDILIAWPRRTKEKSTSTLQLPDLARQTG